MPDKKDFAASTAEASTGGSYGDIKKVRGFLVDMNRVPPREWDEAQYGKPDFEPKEQIKVDFEEAIVLETFSGDDPPELKTDDVVGKWSFYVPYQTPENTKKGRKPHANGIYMRCFVASSEELGEQQAGKKVSPVERIGTFCTVERQSRLLFSRPELDENKKPKLDDEGEKIMVEIYSADDEGKPRSGAWCFVEDEAGDSSTMTDYIAGILDGLNVKAALRVLLTDPKAKQFPTYKDMLKEAPEILAEALGMKVTGEGDDAKFEQETAASEGDVAG